MLEVRAVGPLAVALKRPHRCQRPQMAQDARERFGQYRGDGPTASGVIRIPTVDYAIKVSSKEGANGRRQKTTANSVETE